MSDLSIKTISRMTDEEAFDAFCRLRWPSGEPSCPRCARVSVYKHTKRRLWACKKCHYQFSVTSGTIFASRKLPIKDLMIAVALFSGAAKGISACAMSRYLGVNKKVAFVLGHKLREAVQRVGLELNGIVEVDGCTIGGHRVATNILLPRQEVGRQAERVRQYRRNYEHRRVVVGIREKHNPSMDGPGRTRCFVVRKESDALDHVAAFVNEGATIHADMAHAWNGMKKLYRLLQVNHSAEAYVSNEGVHTNNIESFWSLLRKMHHGVHHRMAAENIGVYANELCWRQDNRKLSENDKIKLIISLALSSPPSEKWKGYWQARAAEPILETEAA